MPMPFRDKTGQVFSSWTVLEFAGRVKHNKQIWKCRCDCGTERNVLINSLMNGSSKSCGHNQYQISAAKNTKHGMASTPTYKSWHSMIQRTEGKGGHESYPARKIGICKEWLSFDAFFADMGIRPDGKTLDRIDNSKGYSKENCRWATIKEQMRNRSNTTYVVVNNEKLPITAACEKYKIGISCIRHRLRKGMSAQEAFTKQTRNSHGNRSKQSH
jgi:hypothetical protein